MLDTVIMIQMIAIALIIAGIVTIAGKRTSSYASLLITAFFLALIHNIGYLLELRSVNAKEVMAAVKVEYLGSAFIVPIITLFIFDYCRVRMPNLFVFGLTGLGVLVYISIFFYEYTNLYYTSVEFVTEGAMPHIVLGHGILYYVYAAVNVNTLIADIAVIFSLIMSARDERMKGNYLALLASVAAPLIFYIIGMLGVFEGFDPAPMGEASTVAILTIALIRHHIFDVVELANEEILDNLENALIVVNGEYGYEESNKKAREIFPSLQSLSRGDRLPDSRLQAIFDPENDNREVYINNRIYEVHISDLSCVHGRSLGYTLVFIDLTESKKQLSRMRELKESADEANIAKSNFLANVSHEIRTPINVILGMSEVVLRDFKDDALTDYISNIRSSAKTLLNLINDILDFSKMEAGKFEIAEEDYDVSAVLDELTNVFEFRCEKKGIEFQKKADDNTPRFLHGDPARIKQILNNILSNAVKYTEKGTVRLKCYFEYQNDDQGRLIFSVEDTGIGIKKEDLGRLYEGFVRLDEKRNKSIEGTGLGLNICKSLVELMNGEIKAYSEYGKGSVFTVLIPQKVARDKYETIGDKERGGEGEKETPAIFKAPDARILVVDDSSTNLMVVKELLKPTQVQVETVLSGQECLDRVAEYRYDLILLDHRMPFMDGVETLKRMQQMDHKCKATPVVMLTANALTNAREYYLGEGFTDYIAKPVTMDVILNILRKYLGSDLIKEG